MGRPLLLLHGYSAQGLDFTPLCRALSERGIDPVELNISNYVSLNNEITMKDIAEGLDRAFRMRPDLSVASEFDAIVHSTGMLVIRSWLTNYGAAVGCNNRLKKLKHLIGVAPATWGSPQAHKGRTWLGALVKGNRNPGPDFLTQATKCSTDSNSEVASRGTSLSPTLSDLNPTTAVPPGRLTLQSSSGISTMRGSQASPMTRARMVPCGGQAAA